MTDEKYVEQRLECNAQRITMMGMEPYIWGFKNGVWVFDDEEYPHQIDPGNQSWLRFYDTISSTHPFVNLSLIVDNTNESNLVPLLAINQGVIAKKDFSAGGFLSSQQGMLALGSGMYSISGIPSQFGEPRILLLHSELNALHDIDDHPSESPVDGEMYISGGTIYKYDHTQENPWVEFAPASDYNYNFDTLHIYRFPNSHGHANLKCADIHSDGGIYIRKDDALLSLRDSSFAEKAAFYNYGNSTYLKSYLNQLVIQGGTNGLMLKGPTYLNNLTGQQATLYICKDGTIQGDLQYVEAQSPINGSIGLVAFNNDISLNAFNGVIKAYSDFCFGTGGKLEGDQGGSMELGDSLLQGAEPYIDFHFGRGVVEDYNIRLWNISDCFLYFGTRAHDTGAFAPFDDGAYVLGTPDHRWSYVFANCFVTPYNYYYDALDDLSLVKNYTPKTVAIKDSVTKENVETQVIDPESLSFLTENGQWNLNKTNGFIFGCIKALVHKVEALETELLNLKN